jgi:hypothetical protein
MSRYEYMQLKLSDMLKDVTAHYPLLDIATPNGYVYCKIRQGYGLLQVEIIAQELVAKKGLRKMGITKAKQRRGCGPMIGAQSLFSRCQQLWGKINWGQTRSAPETSGAEILYVLV